MDKTNKMLTLIDSKPRQASFSSLSRDDFNSSSSSDDSESSRKRSLDDEKPKFEEAEKAEQKREYNRLNAARNRKRQKAFVEDLRRQAEQGEKRMRNLERDRDILKAQVEALKQQNTQLLMMNKKPVPQPAPVPLQQQVPPVTPLQLIMALKLYRSIQGAK